MLAIEITTAHSPESLAETLGGEAGILLLRSDESGSAQSRYSIVTARPFLVFQSTGARCELLSTNGERRVVYGNPWQVLDAYLSRYELLDEVDLPFPMGGCFGYWGYDLKNFVEPRLGRRAVNDLELPDSHVGFYASLVVFDHMRSKTFAVCSGLAEDGSRSRARAAEDAAWWSAKLRPSPHEGTPVYGRFEAALDETESSLTRSEFESAVAKAQSYIRAGDIYQVNLSHRLERLCPFTGWQFFLRLRHVSPAPFSAFLDCGTFQLVSSSPELFLRLSGTHILTRPIKGTRPRSADPTRDGQLAYELQTSAKELAELLMITDLLRNDLGRVCAFGTVQVPELLRLEQYPQVQHLVSTVEGRLRDEVTHFEALKACFPGGSVTGAPKIRAMEIIDQLEPVARGPYTGALGYLGFNRESQLSIVIRSAICSGRRVWFHVGAGIVADSTPEAEYEETMAKALGFLQALQFPWPASRSTKAPRSADNSLPA